jgi:hypothetical protein
MAEEGTGSVQARDLGRGWKIAPFISIPSHTSATIASIDGPAVIQHFWITTHPLYWRSLILRFFWDGETTPSIEVPLGDFFCNGWGQHCNVNSLPVAVNPHGGFNSYWSMPFRKHARITLENISPEDVPDLFFQITYSLTEIPADQAYFHAQWRRSNPLPLKQVHTLLNGVQGEGHYVGTYLAWGSHSNGWWGEGEFKFFLDGDRDYPTICGTGTEDYFGGAFCFEHPEKTYATYSTPFLGLPQVIQPDGFNRSQMRFGMYRWHIPDPIRFQEELRVTVQALGWEEFYNHPPKYIPLQDDIASTAFWYQTEPHAPFPTLPGCDQLALY